MAPYVLTAGRAHVCYERQKKKKENKFVLKLTSTSQFSIRKIIVTIVTKHYQVSLGHSLINSLQPFGFSYTI